MQRHVIEAKEPIGQSGRLRAASRFCHDRGISNVTLWRHSRAGLVRLVNINGKNYVDMESVADFDRRALQGDFAKPPHGAAKRSHDAARKAANNSRPDLTNP